MDQGRDDHDQKLRLQAEFTGSDKVGNAINILHQFRTVQNLTVAFLTEQIQHMLGVGTGIGINFLSAHQPEGIEHRRTGLGDMARKTPQGVLNRGHGISVTSKGNESGKSGIFPADRSEVATQLPGSRREDLFTGSQAGGIGPSECLAKRLLLALMRHMNHRQEFFPQPLGQRPEMKLGLVAVGLLFLPRGTAGQIQSGSIQPEWFFEALVMVFQFKEHLVRLFLIRKTRGGKGLDEIQVKITGRLGGGTFAGHPEEKPAQFVGLPFRPLNGPLPDAEPGEAGRIRAVEDFCQRLVIGAVQ